MKVSTLALTAATAATAALAQPHNHHQHLHANQAKREVTVTSNVAGPTAYAYVLNGKEISIDEVCNGIGNNELKWASGSGPDGLCTSSAASSSIAASSISSAVPSSSTIVATTSATSAAVSTSAAAEFYQKSQTWSATTSSSAVSSAASSAAKSSDAATSSSSSWSSTSSGVTAAFPDGELDCSTFPSAYGAVALDYLNLGGWSGLQAVTLVSGAYNDIVTGVSGDTCTDGMMCSYACPPGYQKSQWPTTQGLTGQSVGGIQCKNGKLYLTNSALSSSLCIAGVGGVQATNKASGTVSICRTDYPGTESETIPVEVAAGSTESLAVPDASTYYTWQGKSTSAQYYLNPIGYGASDACQWGSSAKPLGNYAPINFGVGYSDGKTWLSIFQNSPTTSVQYEGTVELTGSLSGTCKYSNGQYCGATGCNSNGCTVAVTSGTATFVISD